MAESIYRFEFKDPIKVDDVEETLAMAYLTAESTFPVPRVRLDASVYFDKDKNICVIDKSTEVGQHIAQIFTRLLTKAFGESSFIVHRLRKRKKFADQKETKQKRRNQ